MQWTGTIIEEGHNTRIISAKFGQTPPSTLGDAL